MLATMVAVGWGKMGVFTWWVIGISGRAGPAKARNGRMLMVMVSGV